MLRKILSFFFALFVFLPTARGAEMVNVEYIHQYLNARWGIDLPYNPELENPKVAANMEYLLTVVDIANEYLNGEKTTSYGTGEYATKLAADTIATNTAIDTLVKAPTFTITTTPDTSNFSMIIGAAGNFIIDWGDGKRDVIANKPIGMTTYTHVYDTMSEYEIKLSGRATDYSDADADNINDLVGTFALTDFLGGTFMATNVAKISGRLGRVFPTLDDGSNPNFYAAFTDAPITEIPAELFDGIHGAPVVGMFNGTFSGTQITSIPENLFAGISGAPAENMFYGTFRGTQITSIPANLFGELNGDGAPSMFALTFAECDQLQTVEGPLFSGTITPAEYMFNNTFRSTQITSIPANLFGELNGNGAPNMFASTFAECDQLQTVEGPLFSGTLTPAEYMFNKTFSNSSLTSVPANLFGELNGDGAPNMFASTFSWCGQLQTVEGPLFSGTITPAESMFYSTFRSSPITSIPENLFAGISGAPAENMFNWTFAETQITSIPANLFAGISGAPALGMFASTFWYTQITSIPENLFAGISGAPAEDMFNGTFRNTPITSIPENLFAGISGAPAADMFNMTFMSTQITSIPENLFAGISGAPAASMFNGTFWNTQITSIPENLFAGISGAPAERMFNITFHNTPITSIPENLFAGISGPAASGMFGSTFASCSALRGPSARINGQYLYEIWPDISGNMNTYSNDTGLSDYAQIPDNWK